MKTVLITGASGQIGQILVKRLWDEHNLICVDLSDPDEELRRAAAGRPVTFHRLDLLKDDLSNVAGRETVDTVVHLASVVDGSRDIPGRARDTIALNLLTTINVLKMCPAVRHVVFASSMMIYGAPQSSPIGEDHPAAPSNLYGLSKLLVEHALRIHADGCGITLSVLRFTSIYGPGKYSGKSSTRAIPAFIRLARNNESPVIFSHALREKRDYLFIEDAVDALVLTLNRPFHGVVNIGSGRSTTILEVAETILRLCGAPQPVVIRESAVPSSADDYLLDTAKAKSLIGFAPRVTLEQGLQAEIDHA